MNIGQIKVKIVDDGYRMGRSLYIYRELLDGVEMLYTDTVEKVAETQALPKPTLRLSEEEMQLLAEALANQGFNPRKEFIEGKLEATQAHLADMRKLMKLQ